MSRPRAEWRGWVNMLLYGLQMGGHWDGARINRRVDDLVLYQRRGDDPEDFYRAALAALASDEEVFELGVRSGEYGCEDSAAREALAGIVRRLDELRPWPPPPFVELDAERWEELGGAPVIGRVAKYVRDVELAFHPASGPGRGGNRVVLGVRMLSGQPVGLCEAGEWAVELRSPGDPAAVRAEVAAATGLTIDPP